MIQIKNVSKYYNEKAAVQNVSFDVEEGETLVLLGTSGSGKTTTLRMINRLVDADSGSIIIDNKDILKQPPEALRRTMGYVLQGYGLFPHYTVAENISIVPKLLKWRTNKIQQRVDDLLIKLQLPPDQYKDVYPDNLSGGQKQRVGLARALAADPPILLMDEPFGALDPLTRTAVRKEFKDLDELKKKTIILVTHDVQEAFELGYKIGLMDNGELLQLAKPSDLLFKPKNDFVRNFFNHQRLQLEWQSIKLKTIWDDLPTVIDNVPTHLISSQTLWEAMEALVNAESPLTALDKETGTFRQLSFLHLQSAIQKQKQQV
jgi:osmoprotectant transport system ATP-binding protein